MNVTKQSVGGQRHECRGNCHGRFIVDHDFAQTIGKGYRRVEKRKCWLIRNTAAMPQFRQIHDWTDLKALVMIRRQRQTDSRASQEIVYYITSLTSGVQAS